MPCNQRLRLGHARLEFLCDLAQTVPVDRFCEFDILRDLVAGKNRATVCLDVLRIKNRAALADDDRLDRFPPLLVWHPEHGRIINSGQGQKDGFDLARGYVDAASLDHVLEATDDVEVA